MDNINLCDMIKLFLIKENENDINVQKKYYRYMDKILDSLAFLQYKKKRDLNFSTVNELDEHIIRYFEKINVENIDYRIERLATSISFSTHKTEMVEYYCQQLKKIYFHYKEGTMTKDITTKFYNSILNEQQNYYINREKQAMIDFLIRQLSLTEKKLNNLKNGIGMLNCLAHIKNKDYVSANVKEEKLLNNLKIVHKIVPLIQKLKKINYHFTEEDFKYLDNLFMNDKLNYKELEEKYSFFNKRQLKAICNKYYQVLLPYLDNKNLTIENIKLVNVNYNYNHLKFYDFNFHYANAVDFTKNLSNTELNNIINQYDDVKVLFKLLPLVDLLPRFNMITFKNIVLYYPRIKENIKHSDKLFDNRSIEDILNKFPRIIKLSNVYSKADSYTYAILQEKNIERIVDDVLSNDVNKYLKTYINMLKRGNNTIPPISGEYNNYIYESGSSNIERLFIGANCYGSCIKPGMGGDEAFNKALTKNDGDVIFIKEKDTQKFVARSLLFRKDNFVMMAPIYGTSGFECDYFYNSEFLSQIAKQLLSKSKLYNDNIDYIFLTNSHNINCSNNLDEFPIYMDTSFVRGFPYADLYESAYLIASTKVFNEKTFNKKDSFRERIYYPSIRKKVNIKCSDYREEILKIKSLEIVTEEDETKRKILENEFSTIKNTNFDMVYIGQDWYIGMKKDKVLSTGIFDVTDCRQHQEIGEIVEKNHIYFNQFNSRNIVFTKLKVNK